MREFDRDTREAALVAVYRLRGLSTAAKLAYTYVAYHAKINGKARLSIADIAAGIAKKERTGQRLIRKLEKVGLINVVGVSGKVSEYQMTFPPFETLTQMTTRLDDSSCDVQEIAKAEKA